MNEISLEDGEVGLWLRCFWDRVCWSLCAFGMVCLIDDVFSMDSLVCKSPFLDDSFRGLVTLKYWVAYILFGASEC